MVVCRAFGILDRATLTTTLGSAVLAIGGVILAGCALLVLCARFLRRGYALPKTGTGTLSFRGRRRFWGLIAPEIIGSTVLDVALGPHHQAVWIVPADLLLTCGHFIPLAFVFRVRAYLATSILWLLAIAGSMLLWPPRSSAVPAPGPRCPVSSASRSPGPPSCSCCRARRSGYGERDCLPSTEHDEPVWTRLRPGEASQGWGRRATCEGRPPPAVRWMAPGAPGCAALLRRCIGRARRA